PSLTLPHPTPTLFPTRRSSDLHSRGRSIRLGTCRADYSLRRLDGSGSDSQRGRRPYQVAVGLCLAHPDAGGSTGRPRSSGSWLRSEEHTSELQSLAYLVCRLLL